MLVYTTIGNITKSWLDQTNQCSNEQRPAHSTRITMTYSKPGNTRSPSCGGKYFSYITTCQLNFQEKLKVTFTKSVSHEFEHGIIILGSSSGLIRDSNPRPADPDSQGTWLCADCYDTRGVMGTCIQPCDDPTYACLKRRRDRVVRLTVLVDVCCSIIMA